MTVVADASPINYLVLIDAIDLLAGLFGNVLIPEAVSRELQSAGTPPKVAHWIIHQPSWLRIVKAPPMVDVETVERLGDGECEAISLAQSQDEALLLIDEYRGRSEAQRRGIRFMGTLGILDLAAARGLVDLPSAIERLLQTTFYVSPKLWKRLLEEDLRRKRAGETPAGD